MGFKAGSRDPSSPNQIVREVAERLAPHVDSSTSVGVENKLSPADLDFRSLKHECFQRLEVIQLKNNFGISDALISARRGESSILSDCKPDQADLEIPRLIHSFTTGVFYGFCYYSRTRTNRTR